MKRMRMHLNHALEIKDVRQDDSGLYTVVLRNRAAALESRLNITLVVNGNVSVCLCSLARCFVCNCCHRTLETNANCILSYFKHFTNNNMLSIMLKMHQRGMVSDSIQELCDLLSLLDCGCKQMHR